MSELRIADNGIQASIILDAKELNSPMPLFQAKKEITKLTSGQILQVDGTDPVLAKISINGVNAQVINI